LTWPYHCSLCTVPSGLRLKNSTWCSLCVECFVRISEQTATFILYTINRFVFTTVVEGVYSAVRTDSLCKTDCVSSLKTFRNRASLHIGRAHRYPPKTHFIYFFNKLM
jgi:hypothetical protein